MVLTWLQFHLKSLCKIVDFEAFLIPPRGDPKMGEVVDWFMMGGTKCFTMFQLDLNFGII